MNQYRISETDFSEVLGKSRTNQAERDAWMQPKLQAHIDAVNDMKKDVKFYEKKIIIINLLYYFKTLYTANYIYL